MDDLEKATAPGDNASRGPLGLSDLPDLRVGPPPWDDAWLQDLHRQIDAAGVDDPHGTLVRIKDELLAQELEDDRAGYLAQIRTRGDAARVQGADVRKQIAERFDDLHSSYRELVALWRDVGAEVMRRDLEVTDRGSVEDAKFRRRRTISLLHAKAVRAAWEVLELQGAGFGATAHGRWRTIHELAVICDLLAAGDEELTERYGDHGVTGKLRLAKLLAARAPEATASAERGTPSVTVQQRVTQIESELEGLKQKWNEPRFDKPYEWARPLFLGKKQINFVKLVGRTEHDPLGPHHSAASAELHGDADAMWTSVTMEGDTKMVTTGPSADVDPLTLVLAVHSLQSTCNALVRSAGTCGDLRMQVPLMVGMELVDTFVANVTALRS